MLSDLVNVRLERDGLVGNGAPTLDSDELTGRVTSCTTSAVSGLVQGMAEAIPGLTFEIDVDAEYDAGVPQVEIEVVVVVHHPETGRAADVALALLSYGFDYLAGHDIFRISLSVLLRRP